MNQGSGDYALRVASNRDDTGIRVRPRRTIEKGSILKGRRDSRLEHAETGNLLNNGFQVQSAFHKTRKHSHPSS